MEISESTFNKIIDIAKDFYNAESAFIIPDFICPFAEREKMSEKDLEEKLTDWRFNYAITHTQNVMQAASEVALNIQDGPKEEKPESCSKYHGQAFSYDCLNCGFLEKDHV